MAKVCKSWCPRHSTLPESSVVTATACVGRAWLAKVRPQLTFPSTVSYLAAFRGPCPLAENVVSQTSVSGSRFSRNCLKHRSSKQSQKHRCLWKSDRIAFQASRKFDVQALSCNQQTNPALALNFKAAEGFDATKCQVAGYNNPFARPFPAHVQPQIKNNPLDHLAFVLCMRTHTGRWPREGRRNQVQKAFHLRKTWTFPCEIMSLVALQLLTPRRGFAQRRRERACDGRGACLLVTGQLHCKLSFSRQACRISVLPAGSKKSTCCGIASKRASNLAMS